MFAASHLFTNNNNNNDNNTHNNNDNKINMFNITGSYVCIYLVIHICRERGYIYIYTHTSMHIYIYIYIDR